MSKKVLSLVTVLALVLTMVSCATTAFARSAPQSNFTAYSKCSNGKPLNVRSGPSKDYSVIGTIPYGESFTVYEIRDDGWSEIYWGSQAGFVMNGLWSRDYPGKYVPANIDEIVNNPTADVDYNSIYASAKLVTPYTVTLQATANSNNVANVRWAPSKKSTLLRRFAPGTEVTVIAELGSNWYQVSEPMSGVVGFVNSAYVVR